MSWILATTGLCAVDMSRVEALKVLNSDDAVWELRAYCNGVNYTIGLYADKQEAVKELGSIITTMSEVKA